METHYKFKKTVKRFRRVFLSKLNKRYRMAHFRATPVILYGNKKIVFNKTQKDSAMALLTVANKYMIELSDKKLTYTTWKVEPDKDTFTVPSKIRFSLNSLDPMIFAETFIYDIHFIEHNLKNKIVVEGGAFVGDTALYYANKGARVYTFEPNSVNFTKLKNNIISQE